MVSAGASSYDESGGEAEPEPRLLVSDEEAALPAQDNLELAESILQRLQPKDRHEMGQMIYSRSVASGVLLATIGIFWWLTISVIGDRLGDEASNPNSMIWDLSFFQVSLTILALVFIASLALMHSRERSNWSSGAFGAILMIIALYFALEPIGWLVFTDKGEPSLIMQSMRLVALGVMMHYATQLLLDAILLDWVRKLLHAFPLEIAPLDDETLLLTSGDLDKAEEAAASEAG